MAPPPQGTAVRLNVQDSCATIFLESESRLNLLSPAVYDALHAALLEAEQGQPRSDIVLIRGMPGMFAAGADLRLFRDALRNDERERLSRAFAESSSRCLAQIELTPCTVIAAVDGPAYAGGLVIARAADLCVASERATLRLPEGLRGFADLFSAARLPSQIGLRAARRMMLMAACVPAKEALDLGLVDVVAATERFDDTVSELVAEVSRVSPVARALAKEAMNRQLPEYDMRLHLASMLSPDLEEGALSFLEHRPPAWSRSR